MEGVVLRNPNSLQVLNVLPHKCDIVSRDVWMTQALSQSLVTRLYKIAAFCSVKCTQSQARPLLLNPLSGAVRCKGSLSCCKKKKKKRISSWLNTEFGRGSNFSSLGGAMTGPLSVYPYV